MKKDKETLDIERAIKQVGDMVDSEGWQVVAQALQASISEVQNLSQLKLLTPEATFIDLKAREYAVQIVAGWLHDVAGTAEVAREQMTEKNPSYIIHADDE